MLFSPVIDHKFIESDSFNCWTPILVLHTWQDFGSREAIWIASVEKIPETSDMSNRDSAKKLQDWPDTSYSWIRQQWWWHLWDHVVKKSKWRFLYSSSWGAVPRGKEYKRTTVLQTPVKMEWEEVLEQRFPSSQGWEPWWGSLKTSTVRDPHWRSLLLKDCVLWKGLALKQFVKYCGLWEELILKKCMEDYLSWEGHHCGGGEKCEVPYPWRSRSSRNKMKQPEHPFHLHAPLKRCGNVKISGEVRPGRRDF